eukprot:m.282492 g.282492  ORF g.282492 m.282492 type:complete len:189 (+) comp19851_c0_seq4:185-751(+)
MGDDESSDEDAIASYEATHLVAPIGTLFANYDPQQLSTTARHETRETLFDIGANSRRSVNSISTERARNRDLLKRGPDQRREGSSIPDTAGRWDSTECLGLCKAVDLANGRAADVDISLAKFLVPTRSADAIKAKLQARDMDEMYADFCRRRLDRSLKSQRPVRAPAVCNYPAECCAQNPAVCAKLTA